MEDELSEYDVLTTAAKDRAMAYWTDPQRFPTDTDRLFWELIAWNFTP